MENVNLKYSLAKVEDPEGDEIDIYFYQDQEKLGNLAELIKLTKDGAEAQIEFQIEQMNPQAAGKYKLDTIFEEQESK